ncbi:MAG: histidine kinase [Flavobacteriales bacterium]|nr:histidine kinase [Flavobacteriales bacterium]
MRRSLLIAALAMHGQAGTAQFFTNYGPSDGLLDPGVTCVLKDRTGHLWLGTQQGLYRYDGGRFKAYHYDPADSSSLPHDHVERIAEGADGRIWITSGNGGLTMYDPVRDRFLTWRQLTGRADPGAGLPTRAVHCHGSDSIFVGVFGEGIRLYRPSEGSCTRIPCVTDGPEGTAISIVPWPGHPNELLVLLGDRALVLELRTVRTRPFELRIPGCAPRQVIMTAIEPVGPDQIWVCTWGDGLLACDPRSGECVRHLPDQTPPLTRAKNIISDVLPGTPLGMLVGTERGLMRFDPGTGRFRPFQADPTDPHALPEDGIRDLLVDDAGIVWIARAHGLSEWDPAQDVFATRRIMNRIERSMPVPRITGVAELDGLLVVGTSNGDGLLSGQDDGLHSAHPHPHLAPEGFGAVQITGLMRMRSGTVIATTSAGLHAVGRGGAELRALPVTLPPSTAGPLSHLEDHEGQWWFGYQRTGVTVVDPVHGTMQRFTEDGPVERRLSSSVWCQGLAEDRAGRIWVSAYEVGVDRISTDRRTVEHFRASEHPWLRTARIWDLVVDHHDRLWLGTNGRGIVITPANDPGGPGTIQLMGGTSGVPAMVSTLFTDRDGLIWAGGPSGLYRIDPGSLEAKRFDRSDGLRGTDFHHADIRQHPSGRITIAAHRGELIIVDPEKLDSDPGPFGVTVRDLLIHGHGWRTDTALDRIQRIELGPDQNFIELGYGAIAFSRRTRIRLAHQLVGIDPAPVVTGADGRAVYTSLPPGAHRLLITDAGRPADHRGPLRELTIHVRPHPWQTWWFKLATVLAVVGLLVVLWRWRTGVIRDRERLRADLQRRLAGMEMQALRSQMNPHFLFNSLNSINRYIVENEPEKASEYLTKFARLMRSVLANSKEQLVPLKDELDALRLYIEMESLRFKHAFTYAAHVEIDEDISRVMIPPMLLQPYVENAIWHGLMHRRVPGGHLSITVRRADEAMEVLIEDNGVGRKAAEAMKSRSATGHRSMGMRITRERLDLVRGLHDMDADVRITDLYDLHQRPEGTRVVIRLSQRKK